MDLIELTKDAPTMQEVMQKAKNEKLKLFLYKINASETYIKNILNSQKDYVLVETTIGEWKSSTMFIHPYGGQIGYTLKENYSKF